jgi:hypothetical protein
LSLDFDGFHHLILGAGSGGDAGENAENPTRLLGKILRIDVESQAGVCNVARPAGDLNIPNARILASGNSGRSVLHARMNRRNDPAMMPPIASTVRDTAGEQLIRAWIDSLTAADCQ